jgi:hypothetical protein
MDGAKTVVARGAAYAGPPSRPILDPGTLLLLTTGLAGLS